MLEGWRWRFTFPLYSLLLHGPRRSGRVILGNTGITKIHCHNPKAECQACEEFPLDLLCEIVTPPNTTMSACLCCCAPFLCKGQAR